MQGQWRGSPVARHRRRPGQLGPDARLAGHRELRPAAAAGLGGAADGAGGLAGRPHLLAGVGRVPAPGPRGVRPADRRRPGRRGRRGAGVAAAGAGRGRRCPTARAVCVPDMEFTSNLFPWLVHADRGVTVRTVAARRAAGALADGADVVAFSLVQSSDGTIAPYEEIVQAARAVGATGRGRRHPGLRLAAVRRDARRRGGRRRVQVADGPARHRVRLSRAVGARPDPAAHGRLVRGGGRALARTTARRCGWPRSARRFDLSPAWFSWVGAAPALELIEAIGIPAIHDHNVGLANRFLAGLGQPPGDRAIVTVEVPDAAERLARAGVRAAERAGRVRASFHVYTTERDVDLALDALTRLSGWPGRASGVRRRALGRGRPGPAAPLARRLRRAARRRTRPTLGAGRGCGWSPPTAASPSCTPRPARRRRADLDAFVAAARRPRRLGLLLARQSAVAVGVADGRRAGRLQGGLVLCAESHRRRRLVAAAVRPPPGEPGQGRRRVGRRHRGPPAAARGRPAGRGGGRRQPPRRRRDPRRSRGWPPVAALRSDRFLDVPEPRLAVLQRAVAAARAVRIRVRRRRLTTSAPIMEPGVPRSRRIMELTDAMIGADYGP